MQRGSFRLCGVTKQVAGGSINHREGSSKFATRGFIEETEIQMESMSWRQIGRVNSRLTRKAVPFRNHTDLAWVLKAGNLLGQVEVITRVGHELKTSMGRVTSVLMDEHGMS